MVYCRINLRDATYEIWKNAKVWQIENRETQKTRQAIKNFDKKDIFENVFDTYIIFPSRRIELIISGPSGDPKII